MPEISAEELAALKAAAKQLEEQEEQAKRDEWNRVDQRRREADGGL